MKNPLTQKFLLAIGAVLSMASCVDDNYDLSDIDSTTRIEVKDLVVPINLDVISLESILDIKEGEAIQVIDGQYAIVKGGSVDAAQINIPAVSVKAPVIKPTESTVYAEGFHSSSPMKSGLGSLRFPLSSTPPDCKYSTSDVSDYIVAINSCECDVSLDLTVSLVEAKDIIRSCDFSDIVFQLPKGLSMTESAGGSYNPNTGELYIADKQISGSALTVHLEADGIDFSKTNYSYNNPTLTVDEKIYLKSGFATISASDIVGDISSIPTSLTLRTEYVLSDINIKSFTGRIKYEVDDVNIPEVSLNDLPNVLSQEGTDISITNPCLYLQFNNALQQYELKAQSGLSMTAIRPGEADKTFGLNPGQLIAINTNHPDGSYSFCLSPEMPSTIDAEFAGAEHVGYSSLSYVLSGNGMPKSIKVNLVDPIIPDQPVNLFPLGADMGKISGKYKLVAPLNFMSGSYVTYANDMDGWNDEEFDKVTITTLTITMKASSDVPVALDFTAYPIDVDGKQIGDVEVTGAQINANAQDQEITLRITGQIQHLDGLRYRAVATAAADGKTISPDMTITLKDVRPVVSGYYEKEL